MTDSTRIYSQSDKQLAQRAARNALTIYCLTAVGFAAVCAGFVVLFDYVNSLLTLCVAVNFLLSIAFFWYTVIFFYTVYPRKRERSRFFKIMDGALITRACGIFVGAGDTVTVGKVEYSEALFEIDGQREALLVLSGVTLPFVAGIKYDLQKIGERITAFAEVADV